MALSSRDYRALKRAAELADAQKLLNQQNLLVSAAAGPLIGLLVGLLLFLGIGISIVSSEREHVHQDRVALNETLR